MFNITLYTSSQANQVGGAFKQCFKLALLCLISFFSLKSVKIWITMKISSIVILLLSLSAGMRVIFAIYTKTCLWRRITISVDRILGLRIPLDPAKH